MSFDTLFVGVAGFEPATPWSQTRYSNRTEPHPEQFRQKRNANVEIQIQYLSTPPKKNQRIDEF